MKKKLACVVVIITMLVSMFSVMTGCANPFDDDNNREEVEGKTTVKIIVQNEPAEKALMMQWKSAFEKQNDKINIYIESFTGAYQNEMLRLISSKTLPDITWVGGNVHANFSANGHYVDLKPYFEKDGINTSKIVTTSLDSTRFNDTTDTGMWFAPRDYSKIVTYVNVDMLEAAGIPMPTTEEFDYDKFFEICGQLRSRMDRGTGDADRAAGLLPQNYPLQFGIGWDPIYKAILASHGATDYNADGTIGLETREAKLAYKQVGELYKRRYTITPAATDSEYFPSKKTAFTFGVRPYMATLANKFTYNVLPFPFEKVGAGCSGYGITSVSEVKDEAWEFIKFIMSDAGQNIFGDSGMGIPAFTDQWETTSWNKYYKTEEQGFNHDVFINSDTNTDSVIGLNSINVYAPSKHLTILQNTSAIFQMAIKAQTWVNSPLAADPIITDAWKSAGNWSGLDAAIKSYLAVINAEIAKK